MPNLKQHAEIDNFLVTLVRDPQCYKPLVEMLDHVVTHALQLSWLDLEYIGLAVTKAAGSDYCSALRQHMQSELSAEGTKLSPNVDALASFAVEAIKTPGEISQSRIKQLTAFGWSEQTLEDVIVWACVLQMFSNLDQAFGYQALPDEIMQGISAGTLQSQGYLNSFNYFVEQMN